MKTKTLVAVLLLSCAQLFAADTYVKGAVNFLTLQRGTSWSAINGNYVFDSVSPATGVCITVTNNNPTSAHSALIFTLFQTADFATTTYTGNTGRWINATPQNLSPLAAIPAGSTVSAFVRTAGAFHYELTISGAASATGSPDTVDIFVVQNGSGCGAATVTPTWSIISSPATGSQATVTLAAVAGVIHVAQCVAISESQQSTTAVANSYAINDGATTIFRITIAVEGVAGYTTPFSLCGLNLVGTRGNSMSISSNAGAPSVNQSVFLSGYDTQ